MEQINLDEIETGLNQDIQSIREYIDSLYAFHSLVSDHQYLHTFLRIVGKKSLTNSDQNKLDAIITLMVKNPEKVKRNRDNLAAFINKYHLDFGVSINQIQAHPELSQYDNLKKHFFTIRTYLTNIQDKINTYGSKFCAMPGGRPLVEVTQEALQEVQNELEKLNQKEKIENQIAKMLNRLSNDLEEKQKHLDFIKNIKDAPNYGYEIRKVND